jgi:monoterpene epsilon-lactone hydrolase
MSRDLIVDFASAASISGAAAEFYETTLRSATRNQCGVPSPSDLLGWRELNRKSIEKSLPMSNRLTDRYRPTLIEADFGGVPVLDIRPSTWSDDRKVLIYAHGGAYVDGSAASSLNCTLPLAHESGLRIIAVDYSLAPSARFPHSIEQFMSVVRALHNDGHVLGNMALCGDSAGGAIVTAAALKLGDEGLDQLGGVILRSPWADITETGDTYMTLKDAEPLLSYASFLSTAACAYADPIDFAHPHVSPVYADFACGFPPTLIQCGTRDLFLSNAVRLYQRISLAGQQATLDVYEGMWHGFHSLPVDLPEAQVARAKARKFLETVWAPTADVSPSTCKSP